MGRVLVFTLPTCTHCRAAKATLARRGVPYVEVSLSAHPTRRGDMESLSNRATVPQIFLNDHHVGGASDLQTLIDADPDAFDARARAALAAPDPADPRLAAPAPDDADDERTRGSLAPSRDDRTARVPSHPRPVILTLAGEPIDHVAAVALLREILPWRTVPGTSPCSVDASPDQSPSTRCCPDSAPARSPPEKMPSTRFVGSNTRACCVTCATNTRSRTSPICFTDWRRIKVRRR